MAQHAAQNSKPYKASSLIMISVYAPYIQVQLQTIFYDNKLQMLHYMMFKPFMATIKIANLMQFLTITL